MIELLLAAILAIGYGTCVLAGLAILAYAVGLVLYLAVTLAVAPFVVLWRVTCSSFLGTHR